jgi:hypothetical protein
MNSLREGWALELYLLEAQHSFFVHGVTHDDTRNVDFNNDLTWSE